MAAQRIMMKDPIFADPFAEFLIGTFMREFTHSVASGLSRQADKESESKG